MTSPSATAITASSPSFWTSASQWVSNAGSAVSNAAASVIKAGTTACSFVAEKVQAVAAWAFPYLKEAGKFFCTRLGVASILLSASISLLIASRATSNRFASIGLLALGILSAGAAGGLAVSSGFIPGLV